MPVYIAFSDDRNTDNAGIRLGEIVEVNEKTALIKVDGDTKLRVDKNGLVKDYSESQQQ